MTEWLRALIFHYRDHLTAVQVPNGAHVSQALPADVSGGYSQGSLIFTPPTDWPVFYELK